MGLTMLFNFLMGRFIGGCRFGNQVCGDAQTGLHLCFHTTKFDFHMGVRALVYVFQVTDKSVVHMIILVHMQMQREV